MRICIIIGTRPEIIKMSPVIRECEKRNIDYFVVHTGQHYSYELDKIFFDNLNLPAPKYNLETGSGSHGEMTGKMLIYIEQILQKEKPFIVLVQGDTNSVLAGSLAAAKINIKVGHIEAGLRSYDRAMPEEINRILTDHLADFLFAPTPETKKILLKEGISKGKIFMVGNTIVDAINFNLGLAQHSNALTKLNLSPSTYAILTLHRPSNVDNKENLQNIFRSLSLLKKLKINKILFPIHPRTECQLKKFKIRMPDNIIKILPVDYLSMLKLLSNAKLILTDSGGLQEEACVLKTPCVTLRDNTERPETLKAGGNILSSCDEQHILNNAEIILRRKANWKNPFGSGNSAQKILDIIMNSL